MKKKYIKLNDNYSHLSLGNIIATIKNNSKNKTSAIQGDLFCAIFDIEYINESTVNNYCTGSRSINDEYKQKMINLKKKYAKDELVFMNIICNILSIINGTIYNVYDINYINQDEALKNICLKLINISKNDYFVPKEKTIYFNNLYQQHDYYHLFIELLLFSILDKVQPLYETDFNNYIIESLLNNTNISIIDLQDFLQLELSGGINFSHSLLKLAEDGNPYANYELAIKEYRGEFSGTPRYDMAYQYFLKSASNHHPSAYWMLGNMIMNNLIGSSNEFDAKMAFNYFAKAMELGNIAAINSIGKCYKLGYGVKKDIETAKKYFFKAAEKNYSYALNNLAKLYEEEGNLKKAYECYLKSANLKESYANNKMGEFERLKGNAKVAFNFYKEAINTSINEIYPWAYYNLAKYYYLNGNTESNIFKDENKAIEYFKNSTTLIESLIELFLIYYQKYQDTLDNNYLNKMYQYKDQIEHHPNFDKAYLALIENKIKMLKKPLTINLDKLN